MIVAIKRRESSVCEIHEAVTDMCFLTAGELGLDKQGFKGKSESIFAAINTAGSTQYYLLDSYMVKVVG